MSKFVASLAAAIMMVVGLATGGTATAAPAYPATVKTKTAASVPSKVKAGKKIKVGVKVTAAGTAKPQGTVTVTLLRKVGKKWVKVTVKSTAVKGGAKTVGLPAAKKPGKYRVVVSFKPAKNSVYKKSSKTVSITVKR